MKKLAPICLFTYNRLHETRLTIEALQKNFLARESDLIIFSDGAKNEQSIIKTVEVKNYLKTISGFRSVTVNESIFNKGLANSIVEGVSQVLEQYGKIIVLEDDLLSTPNFLDFMNQALDFYKESNQIQSVNGYSLKIKCDNDIYFHRRTFPWGWATWQDRWTQDLFDKNEIHKKINENKKVLTDFNKICGNDISSMLQDSISGANNSWYVRWVFNHFLNENYAVFPKLSKINNIGFIDEGTHCLGINTYENIMDEEYKRSFSFIKFKKLGESSNNSFLGYFRRSYKFLFRLKLLKTSIGRTQIFKEIKNKFFIR